MNWLQNTTATGAQAVGVTMVKFMPFKRADELDAEALPAPDE